MTVLHLVADNHVDAVWIQAFNPESSDVDVTFVLNAADDTDTDSIDDVAVTLTIPAKDSLWILQGDSFRLNGTNTSTIAAYVATADIGKVRCTGHIVRVRGALLH